MYNWTRPLVRCDWSVACTEACGDIKESHNLHTPR